MRTKILFILPRFLLAGCPGTTQYVVKTVEVDKPILVCPAPPKLEDYEFQVNKLTPEDIKDPGKVAQRYKADMYYLRRMEGVYKDIIDRYNKAREDARKAREQVDKIFKNNQQGVDAAIKQDPAK